VVRANPERLTAIIEHIIRNAQDATVDHGEIEVVVCSGAQGVELSVKDSGTGMDPDFLRDRLFRPFDSTKGSKGMGIGAYQVRDYVRQLGGRVEVQSSPGQGTIFSVILPAALSSADSQSLTASH
jgi:signal transduction histidine kinase